MADTAALIAEHEDYLRSLEDLKRQVLSVQPTGYYAFGRGQAQFNKDRQAKLLELEQAAKRSQQDLNHLRANANKPAAGGPKPLTEAQSLAADARDQKRIDEIATQETQKKLAASKLEQQKAADAVSIPALGVGGQSLKDLLTNSTIKKDADGNYVFSQDNTGAKLTPVQAAKAAQLKAGIAGQAGATAEQLFGSGIAPKFDKNGQSIFDASGNPFIGTRPQYEALAKLYQASQPAASVDLVVPATTLDKVYKATAPAYGDTFPGNPVEQDAKTPAAKALVEGRTGSFAPLQDIPVKFGFSPTGLSPADSLLPNRNAISQLQAQPPGGAVPVPPAEPAQVLSGLSTKYNVAPEVVDRLAQTGASPEETEQALATIGRGNTAAQRAEQVGKIGTAAGLLMNPLALPAATTAAAVNAASKVPEYLLKSAKDQEAQAKIDMEKRNLIHQANGEPLETDSTPFTMTDALATY